MDRWCCSADEKLAFKSTTLGNREEQVQLNKILEEQAMQQHQRHQLKPPAAIPNMVSSQHQNFQCHLQRQRQQQQLQIQEQKVHSYQQQQQQEQNSILLHPPAFYQSWRNRLVLEQQNNSSSTGLALSYLGPKQQLDQVHAQQRPGNSILPKKPRFRSSKATTTSSYIDATTIECGSSPSPQSGSFASTTTTMVDGQEEHRLYHVDDNRLAPQYSIQQQHHHHQQKNRQGEISHGRLRYRECMDYAHLGCRHFVPWNDDDLDPTQLPMSRCANNPAAHQEGATRTIKVKVALPRVVNYSSSPSPQQQEQEQQQQQQQAQMAGPRRIGLQKLEAGRFFVGHFQDPARVKRAMVRKGIEDSSRSGGSAAMEKRDDERKKPKEVIEIDKQKQQQQQQGCCSSSEMAVSQVTCVESGESGNGPDHHSEQQQEQEGGRMDVGVDLGTWSLATAEMGMGARLKEEQEEQGGDSGIEREGMEQEERQGDDYSLAAEALDVLAQAAIQVSGSTAGDCSLDCGGCEGEFQSDEDTLGMKRNKEARFVHGEIPFVQKRVRRCAKPSKVGGHQVGDQSCSSPDSDSQSIRVSRRRVVHSKRLLQDEYEYELPAVKKSRIEKKVAAAKPSGKKSDRKIATTANNKIKDVDLKNNSGESVKPAKKKGAGGQKKRNLSSVVKRSEVNQRDLVKVEENGHGHQAGNGIKPETAAANGGEPQQQLSYSIQDPEEACGAVVRSKRGRNQNLPIRFQSSVLGTWKKGDRKKAKV